ncbi:PDC1 [Symbiodinium natans]|uniref:PDC1 protein n=1 Tax=Symbiodinium natans TaxID=878477 RepID=A0A812SUV9_9DINO|nr:PDC1 [Symbiodinium natans]
MDAKEVISVLRPLTKDQVLLVCWRFRHDPAVSDSLTRLRSFVYSCKKNGFWETKNIDLASGLSALLKQAAFLEAQAVEPGAPSRQPPQPPPPPPPTSTSAASSAWRPAIRPTAAPDLPRNGPASDEGVKLKAPPVPASFRPMEAPAPAPKKVPPPPPPPAKEKTHPLAKPAELLPKAPPPGWLPIGAATGSGELPKKAPPVPPPVPQQRSPEIASVAQPPPAQPLQPVQPTQPHADSKALPVHKPDVESSEPATKPSEAPPADGLEVGMTVKIADGKIKGQGTVVSLSDTKAKVQRKSGGMPQEVNRSKLRPCIEEAKAGRRLREICGPATGALQRKIAEVIACQLHAGALRDLTRCSPQNKAAPDEGSAGAWPKPTQAASEDDLAERFKRRLEEAEAREKELLRRIAELEKDNAKFAEREAVARESEARKSATREREAETQKREMDQLQLRLEHSVAGQEALSAKVRAAEEQLEQERARHREVENDLNCRLDWATQRLHDWQTDGGNRWVEERLQQLKRHVEDLLREEVAVFADSWGMPEDQVASIFERLTTWQQKLVMKRFKGSKGSPVGLLRKYVSSCLHYGFTQDEIKDFAQKWAIPYSDAQDILGDLEVEQQKVVIQRFHYDERTANQSTASAQLKTYVSTCRQRGFWVADKKETCCKQLSAAWQLPQSSVRDLLVPLSLEQCEQLSRDRQPRSTESDGWAKWDSKHKDW